jgi:hypothetical protein
VYYDMRRRALVNDGMSGTIGSISWKRLAEQLRAAGELQPGETVTGFEVMPDSGLRYRVERNPT